MNKVKNFLSRVGTKARAAVALGAVAAMTAVSTVVSSAADVESASLSSYTTQITDQFTTLASDVVPIIIGVLGAGLVIFGVFMAIRLGKKMFSTVSK